VSKAGKRVESMAKPKHWIRKHFYLLEVFFLLIFLWFQIVNSKGFRSFSFFSPFFFWDTGLSLLDGALDRRGSNVITASI